MKNSMELPAKLRQENSANILSMRFFHAERKLDESITPHFFHSLSKLHAISFLSSALWLCWQDVLVTINLNGPLNKVRQQKLLRNV